MICTCSNELEAEPVKFKVRISPCRCEKPAGQRQGARHGIPAYCFEAQYNERRAAGLPLECDLEKSIRSRWV